MAMDLPPSLVGLGWSLWLNTNILVQLLQRPCEAANVIADGLLDVPNSLLHHGRAVVELIYQTRF